MAEAICEKCGQVVWVSEIDVDRSNKLKIPTTICDNCLEGDE